MITPLEESLTLADLIQHSDNERMNAIAADIADKFYSVALDALLEAME